MAALAHRMATLTDRDVVVCGDYWRSARISEVATGRV
jgi:hypothetical protein